MTSKSDNKIKAFTVHGFEEKGRTDGNVFGVCPFCYKDKFYINADTQQWDCKAGSCARKGNINTFFSQIIEVAVSETSDKDFRRIAKNRGISWKELKKAGLGFSGSQWLLPVHSFSGAGCVDLRRWKEGAKKVFSTPSASLGIFNVNDLIDPEKKTHPVWVTEGEFDCIALRWMLARAKQKGVVISVPGANVFKQAWSPLFENRTVRVVFDNDAAGTKGMTRVWQLLKDVKGAKLAFIHWSDTLVESYDIRDLAKETKIKAGPRSHPDAFKAAVNSLRKALQDFPPGLQEEQQETAETSREDFYKDFAPMRHADVFKGFKKYLDMKTSDPLVALFGAMLANRIGGDPVWMFFIGPPGAGKTELLMALCRSPECFPVSSLTPRSLISGVPSSIGKDPSLLPQLNNKILIVKDFTAILSQNPLARDEIFGTLRDVYDGEITKIFGNGITRHYKVNFGMIAGVTPAIDSYASSMSSLGERYLKYRMSMPAAAAEENIISAALGTVGKEKAMKEGLGELVMHALAGKSMETLPSFEKKHTDALIAMAQLCSRLRGTVDRDKYKEDLILAIPSREVGTRIGKQLAKHALGMTCYLDLDTPNERVMKICRKEAFDSIPARRRKLVRLLMSTDRQFMSVADISKGSRLPDTTIRRIMSDCEMLGVTKCQKSSARKHFWGLSETCKRLLKKAGYKK